MPTLLSRTKMIVLIAIRPNNRRRPEWRAKNRKKNNRNLIVNNKVNSKIKINENFSFNHQFKIEIFHQKCNLFEFYICVLSGKWIVRDSLTFIRNRRGNINLVFDGYIYTIERKYATTWNWVCNKTRSLRCPGRCTTSNSNTIKLGKKPHNHETVYDPSCANLDEIIKINLF